MALHEILLRNGLLRPESIAARSTLILKIAVTSTNDLSADALSQRGLDLLAAGSAAEATLAFRAAIAADPRHIEAHHGLVRALRDSGRLEQSIAAALALTALTPSDRLPTLRFPSPCKAPDIYPRLKPPPPRPSPRVENPARISACGAFGTDSHP